MRKKLAIFAAVPLLALATVVIPTALAQGWFGGASATPEQIVERQTDQFQRQADILGLNLDEVKDAWAQGKSLQQIAQDRGISVTDMQNKMKELRKSELASELKVLVDQGVITQSQADQRLQIMGDRINSGQGRHGNRTGGMMNGLTR